MSKDVVEFIHRSTNLLNSIRKNANLTRDEEIQEEGYRHLTALAHEVIEHKKVAINRGDQNAANLLLCIECIIDANRSELRMWIQLKNYLYNEAWNSLISAQQAAKGAARAHKSSEEYNVDKYIDKLNIIEEIIFPEQAFDSPVLIVNGEKCTICKKSYENCNHIAGMPYWGEFCQVKPEKIIDCLRLTIVDEPKDKKARIYSAGKGDETKIDLMTGLPTEDPLFGNSNDQSTN